MGDNSKQTNQPLDLSSLEGLTLGTAWTESKSSAPQGDRTERREGGFRREGGPRREGFRPERRFGERPQGGQGRPQGDRPQNGERRGDGRPQQREGGFRRNFERPAPIVPPSIKVVFYPEETPFKALTKAVKSSKRTYELFEITRLILGKSDRYVVTISNKAEGEAKATPLYQSIADGVVFATEVEAVQHASKAALEKFYTTETVETEGPKGNFVVIHRCGITGSLIAPPNYHRYNAILAQHVAEKLPNMSVEAVQAKLESVKETELINQWVEEQKKITRYTLKTPVEGQTSSFDGLEAARAHLVVSHKAELVSALPQIRMSGKAVEALPSGEIRRSIEAAAAMQLKFPLETANNLRGRLRRIGFNLYKRGPKGVSYLCATKRKFRVPGQAFTPEIQQVIEFIEKNPLITDVELPKQLLGITPPAPIAPVVAALAGETPAPVVAPVSNLTAEEQTALSKLKQTIQWLTEEGYVIYYGNGTLFVPPARLPNAPKEEGEEEASAETAPEATAEATTEAAPEQQATPEVTEQKPEEPKA